MEKLVRDRIPAIMVNAGKSPKYRALKKDERLEWLLIKLQEETAELNADRNAEEGADVLEVVFAIAAELGTNQDELQDVMSKNRLVRGGFTKGFLLTISK